MNRSITHWTIAGIFGLSISSAGLARAGLEWKTRMQKVEASGDAGTVTVQFPFKNTGDKPVVIKEVRTSCGCVVPKSDKKSYAPGENGVIEATLTVGNQTGLQRKMVTVGTDEAGVGSTVLMLAIQLPDAIAIRPEALEWKLGGELVVQRLRIVLKKGVEIASVESSTDAFDARLVAGSERDPDIEVQPRATDKPMSGLIRVTYRGSAQGMTAVPARVR